MNNNNFKRYTNESINQSVFETLLDDINKYDYIVFIDSIIEIEYNNNAPINFKLINSTLKLTGNISCCGIVSYKSSIFINVKIIESPMSIGVLEICSLDSYITVIPAVLSQSKGVLSLWAKNTKTVIDQSTSPQQDYPLKVLYKLFGNSKINILK